MKQAASAAKAQPVPKAVTTRPAATGPTTRVADVVTFKSEFAGSSSRSATIDGRIDCRAGRKNASTTPKIAATT